jgi:hypothetical protein
MLSEYSIIPAQNVSVSTFPLHEDGEIITPELHVTAETGVPFPTLHKVRLDITSSHRGRKTVFEEEQRSADRPTAAAVLGYLSSPYEDRIAVLLGYIYGNQQRGFVGGLRIIGVSITKGFPQN